MKTILLTDLMNCPAMWHELIPLGMLRGGELIIEDSLAERLSACPKKIPAAEWSQKLPPPPSKPIDLIPRDQWPQWAELLAKVARPGEKGIGDVIASTIGPIGGDIFKKWYEKITGHPCGCSERQESLNQLYPLGN